MQGFRCWSAEGVAETVYSDIGLLTESADALFLAAHSPIELEHRRGAELGLASSGEAKVLEALTSRIGSPDRNTLVAVTGDSGSGKSHVVRWVRSHLPDDDSRYRLLYVPRAVQTLRELLRRIIEGLPGAEGGDLMKQVDSAFTGVRPGQFQDRLVFEIKYALRWTMDDFAAPEDGETPEESERRRELNELLGFRDDEVGRKDGLADLLDIPAFAGVLLRPDGHLRQLVESYFNETSRRDDNDEVFTKEDLPIGTPGISRQLGSNRDLLELWQIIARKPEDALRLLEEALRIALPRATGLRRVDGETLDSLFRKSRKALRAKGRELVLIFEDLAMFGLVDGELYDQFATAPGEDLAPLRVLFAITDSPYARMPQTVRTRIEHEFRVGESALSKPAEFVARYLNLVRVGRQRTQELWSERSLGSAEEQWMANSCDTREAGRPCRHRDECHASFGTVPVEGLGNVGLYPYSHTALERARTRIGESATPRAVLDSCLLTVLPEADGHIERGTYPHEGTRRNFDFKVSTPKDALLQQHPSVDPERMYRALVIWGNEKPLATGISDAFALESADVSQSSPPPNPSQPPATATIPLKNRLVSLFQWQNGDPLPEDETNFLRDALRAFTVDRLQLDEQLIHIYGGLGKNMLEDLFNRTSFEIEGSRGRVAGAQSIKFKLTRSAEDTRVLAAVWWFRDHGHFDISQAKWQWPEGYDPGQLMLELEDRLDDWAGKVRDRMLEATGGAHLACQAVGIRALALGASGHAISEIDKVSGALLASSRPTWGPSPAWQVVDSVASQIVRNLNATEYVGQFAAVRQGDTGEAQLVDPRQLGDAIKQFLAQPESSLREMASLKSDPSLAQHAKQLLDALSVSAAQESASASETCAELASLLEGQTPAVVSEAAFNVADAAKDAGFFRPSDQWRKFRESIEVLSTRDGFEALNLTDDLALLVVHQSTIRENRRLSEALLFVKEAMELTRQECERSGGAVVDVSDLRTKVQAHLDELNTLVDAIARQG
jgi:hypothetical protein